MLRADAGASLVVFLVAVPLSLGIAVASGAPVLAGLIAAIVGGVVAGLLGGSPLQVSGPAAGLTVVVAELVNRFGWQATTAIVAGAGVLQVGFGLSRVGRFAQAIPPAVVHGMLAGIGGTIALAQLHVVLGGSPAGSVLENLRELPARLLGAHVPAVAVGVFTVVLVVGWPRIAGGLKVLPGPLVAVTLGTGLSLLLVEVPRVDLPGDLLSAVALPVLPEGDWAGMVGGALTVALIASVESLLSAVAVDRMHHGPRTNVDRELLGQGAANTLSGLLGGLPVTGVIVRSSTNVRAGAKTRTSAVLHGVWIAVFALALVAVIETIPLAALAGLLVVVGIQLVKPTDMRAARQHGELAPYAVTAIGVMALNLLEGVALGLALAALQVLRRAVRARVRHHGAGSAEGEHLVTVDGAATFLCVPTLSKVLADIPAGADTRLELAAHYLDHAARDHLDAWAVRQRATGARVVVTDRASTPAPRGLRVGPLAGTGAQPGAHSGAGAHPGAGAPAGAGARLAEPRRPLGYADAPEGATRAQRDVSQLETSELHMSFPDRSRSVGDMPARHRRG
jgi:carbonic anhydrase